MNSDFSNLPPEERELRLTALLLDELPPAEADQLRAALDADPELAREHARLQQTIALVRETSAMDRKTSADGTPLRLDEQRRAKLLAAFKTPAPQAVAPRRPRHLQFLPLALAAALVGLLIASVMLPSLAKSKARAHRVTALPAFGQSTTDFDSDRYGLSLESRSTRGEVVLLRKRENEVALADNFSLSALDSVAAQAALIAPAPKLPALALAMPALADTDGEARGLKENLSEFNNSGWMENPAIESLARRSVNRELARGSEVAFGNTRDFFDDNQSPAPEATKFYRLRTEDSGAIGGLGGVASPSAGSVLSGNAGYANATPVPGYNLIPAPAAPPLTPLPASVVSADQAQSTSEARKLRLIQLSSPTTPAPLEESVALGMSFKSTFEQKPNVAEQTVEGASLNWDAPALAATPMPAAGFGGGGGRGGGGRRGGLVGGGAATVQGGGATYGGISIAPGGQPEIAGRNIYDPTAVEEKKDGLADLTTTVTDGSSSLRFRYVTPPETAPLAVEAKLKQVEDRFGRPDDFSVTPEMLDAVKLQIQSAPSSRGLAGMSAAKDSLSASRPSLATTPNANGRQFSSGGLRFIVPAQTPAPPASGPATDGGITTYDFIAGDNTAAYVTQLVADNAPVNYFADLPATAGGNTYAWKFTGNDSWFGGVGAGNNDGSLDRTGTGVGRRLNSVVNRAGGAAINDPEATRTVPGVPYTVPSSVRGFYDDNVNTGPEAQSGKALADVNGRVTVQLPALAGEPQLGRQSSPTRPAGGRQWELASEVSGAVVAEPVPANVAMTGITTLSDGSSDLVLLLEIGNSEKEVAEQRTKLPAPAAFASTNRFVGRSAFLVTNETMFNHFSGTNVGNMPVAGKISSTESEGERRVPAKPSSSAPTPQPEVLTRDNAFSTFSLNVSDVSFKLTAASLEKGAMPDVATVRSEEFINAFDYRDPVPAAGVPLAFVSERARYPFAHNRDVLRFSVKTAAQGRDGGKPLNIVLLLDNSGSMERADRVRIIQEALRALAAQLQPQDKLSVVTFSRTARLWADGVTGAQAAEVANKIAALTPEGGTNLEEALDLAYRTALRHYAATAINRVVLLTDGAANLGNVEPATLKAKVENFRKQGVALDCFGIGWEGFNDDLLENLSRNGDGRYGFVNTPEEASTEFAGQLAGALQVAASDVKVQVEFNPKRVTAYRQIGYAKHQLTKQQFRDNTVDAAEISASEAGNALYVIETNPRGEGPIATVRARFRIPQTSDYREHEWVVPFGSAVELEQSSSALRLATSASAFSEWLAGSPFAGEVTTDRLLGLLSGVPEVYGADPRPKKLEWMIRQAKSISGK